MRPALSVCFGDLNFHAFRIDLHRYQSGRTVSREQYSCRTGLSEYLLQGERERKTSGVVTTNALSAPAIAFWNPCSIPAGQSRMT